MFDVVRILHKELHYQIIRSNPMIANDPRKFRRAMNRLGIKRTLAFQSVPFLAIGSIIAMGVINQVEDRALVSSFAVSISALPFIFALYVTAVQSSYSVSLGLFEYLKTLPVRIGTVYLSELLLIDILPWLALVVPSVIVISLSFGFAGALFFLWLLVGLLAGHTIGLLAYSLLGWRLSLSNTKTRMQPVKNLLKIVGMLALFGFFYGITSFQRDVDYSRFTAIFARYEYIYPFTVTSIFEPYKSLMLVSVYVIVLIPVYYYSLGRVWNNLLEPKAAVKREIRSFRAGFGGQLYNLAMKDLRIVFRKGSLVVGFLIPLYFILPQIAVALRSGNLPVENVFNLILFIALISIIGATVVLRIEGKEVDFLRALPIHRNQFVLSKAISASPLPIVISVAIACLGIYFDVIALYLVPIAFLLPFTVFMITMLVSFRGIEELGVPEITIGKTIILFIINGAFLGVIGAPVFLLSFPAGLMVSYGMVLALLYLLLRKLSFFDSAT
ncbi:MAG: hypothetical protein ACOC5C_00175 [Halobacteriota archaeon]